MSELPNEVQDLRRRGYAGGEIPEHRAFRQIQGRKRISWSMLALIVIMTAATVTMLPAIARFWQYLLEILVGRLGIAEVIVTRPRFVIPLIRIDVPEIVATAPLPSRAIWLATLLITIVLLVVSFLLPKRMLPIAYLLRALVFIQTVSLIYFAFLGRHFPYTVQGYSSDMYTIGLAVIALTPIVFGLTYFVFDFGVVRKVWIVLIAIGHLSVFIPLQYLVHAAIVTRFSLIFLPVLFMAFGTLLNVSILIAFYGWAMSWTDRLERKARSPAMTSHGRARVTDQGSGIRDQGPRGTDHGSRIKEYGARLREH